MNVVYITIKNDLKHYTDPTLKGTKLAKINKVMYDMLFRSGVTAFPEGANLKFVNTAMYNFLKKGKMVPLFKKAGVDKMDTVELCIYFWKLLAGAINEALENKEIVEMLHEEGYHVLIDL